MVCMDGFVLTHAFEPVDLPTQEQVDAFLPPFEPRQVLDPDDPVTIGAMVGPEAFTEVKYLMHAKQMRALDLVPELAAEFSQAFGRSSGGLVRPYRSADAETIVVALGSVLGTIEGRRRRAARAGRQDRGLGITCFRPFPARGGPRGARPRSAWSCSRRRSPSGSAGSSARTCASRCPGCPCRSTTSSPASAGRPITKRSLRASSPRARRSAASRPSSTFLDLDWGWSSASSSDEAGAALRAPCREPPPRHRPVASRGGRPERQTIKLYQVGPSRSATGCSTPSERTVQAAPTAPTR